MHIFHLLQLISTDASVRVLLVLTMAANLMVAIAKVAPPPIVSSISIINDEILIVEQARVRVNLAEFKKFNPRTFNSEGTNLWLVKKWVDTKENLFEGLFIVEQEKVLLMLISSTRELINDGNL